MHTDLTGKTALVTGGNVGIGRAIALALAERGAEVAITYYSNADKAHETQRALPRSAPCLQLDATKSAEVNRVFGEVAQVFGGHIDILVNNAGHLIARVPIAEMSDEHWHRVMDVNLSSMFYCVRAVIPLMKHGWGRIVNMSSLAARDGGGLGAAAYAASKAGVATLTRGLAKELGPKGITVNAVAPGLILDTPFHPKFTPPEAQQAIIARLPVGRAGFPADVASAVAYLASEQAGFLTGVVMDINGGIWFS